MGTRQRICRFDLLISITASRPHKRIVFCRICCPPHKALVGMTGYAWSKGLQNAANSRDSLKPIILMLNNRQRSRHTSRVQHLCKWWSPMAQVSCKYCSEPIIGNTSFLFTTYPWRHDGDSSLWCSQTFQWAEPKGEVLTMNPAAAER